MEIDFLVYHERVSLLQEVRHSWYSQHNRSTPRVGVTPCCLAAILGANHLVYPLGTSVLTAIASSL